ncbi:hypothetical protein GCM10009808_06620 [Microbacterium sediminicola]|uniref:Tellurite resistance protein TerB n=1 Tax=Microbacterium sediminicola TaxID=415210 RepID=A0ABN2HRB5_9MICO
MVTTVVVAAIWVVAILIAVAAWWEGRRARSAREGGSSWHTVRLLLARVMGASARPERLHALNALHAFVRIGRTTDPDEIVIRTVLTEIGSPDGDVTLGEAERRLIAETLGLLDKPRRSRRCLSRQ